MRGTEARTQDAALRTPRGGRRQDPLLAEMGMHACHRGEESGEDDGFYGGAGAGGRDFVQRGNSGAGSSFPIS